MEFKPSSRRVLLAMMLSLYVTLGIAARAPIEQVRCSDAYAH